MRSFGRVGGLVGAAMLIGMSGSAWAQTIGTASTVRNDVAQVKGAAASPISIGEEVVRNEVVRTGAESATKLVFKDNTNLAIGPTATVTLDRFVFAGENTARNVTVNLVRGAFRFTTGSSEKKAYEIKTPVATIGVRGTVLDILSESGETIVKLQEGQAIVCTRPPKGKRPQCLVLGNPGDTVVVTATSVSRTSPGGPGGFDFAGLCGNDGLCTDVQYAALPVGGTTIAGVLCGR